MRVFVLVVAFTLVRSVASGQVELIHVRPIDTTTANLLLNGLDRSATLRTLIERIEEGDVIVLCSLAKSLRGRHGALVWMSAADDARYVRAAVLKSLDPDSIIATFGHELQHAIELIAARWVTNLMLFEKLFSEIGDRETIGPRSYDTDAARTAGFAVRRELKANPAPMREVFAPSTFTAADWHAEYHRSLDGAAAAADR